jgi:regulator of protease activity HflC (stomatin/prohibitin superfamily)
MGLIILGIVVLIIGVLGSKSDGPISRFKALFMGGGIIIAIIGLLTSIIVQIPAGHVGVQVLFGQVQSTILHEGLSVVNPLVEIKELSVQTQNYTMSASLEDGESKGDDAVRVLSKDGLEVVIDLTILYRVMDSKAPIIYRELGINYRDKIIRPILRSKIRENAVSYSAIDLYSIKREAFEAAITKDIARDFKARGVEMEQLLIRNVNLPNSVKESIERKITAVQEAQRMEYVLQKEQQEAERKRVEATGVADAQKIINSGLSDKLIQFESIKVQKELVNSPNAKIIILGSGKGSPPFIIGQ